MHTCAHAPGPFPASDVPQVLNCLDLDSEVRRLLTSNDQEASLHAVPMWMVTQQHMAKLLKHYRGRFTTGGSVVSGGGMLLGTFAAGKEVWLLVRRLSREPHGITFKDVPPGA